MKLVVFGLTITSSWGNGHATLWRGLVRALGARGHRVVFFERDVSYYAAHRDLVDMPGHDIQLYDAWPEAARAAARHLAEADVAMVTSYCTDAVAACDLVLESAAPVRVFYDLDTPVTLTRLEAGAPVEYVPPYGLGGFDLVLSYTGGAALAELQRRLGARLVRPLYGSVDPDVHRPTTPVAAFDADLSYLGTYADDRQAALTALLLEPARQLNEEHRRHHRDRGERHIERSLHGEAADQDGERDEPGSRQHHRQDVARDHDADGHHGHQRRDEKDVLQLVAGVPEEQQGQRP